MVTNDRATFAELLQRYRVAEALTQEELAERARLSARAISDLERGVKTRPHLTTVRQLAEALQLSVDEKTRFQQAARHTRSPDRQEQEAGDLAIMRGLAPTGGSVSVPARHSAAHSQDGEESPETEQRLPVGGFLGSLPAGPLVAHEAEMTALLGAVEAVASGQGRLVLIAGEAGIGKTRLAQEVTRVVHGRDFVVAAGRCYEPQRSIPYYPFLEALSTAFAAAPSTIQSQAGHRWPYLSRLLPDQLGSAAGPLSVVPEEQDRLFRAVAGFVQAIAEVTPLAILLDDLHWADSASLQLLHNLARQTRAGAVLLLGTYRDVEVNPQHPLEATLRDLSRDQLMERVSLRRLGERQTAEFITETMGLIEAETELASIVYRHTDGNPFFTQQILQALVDNGTLYRGDGQWKRRAIAEIEVPESVRSVIAQRVSRLEREAQEILQEASVLGPAFSFDDLVSMKVSPGDAGDLEDTVDAALIDASVLGLVRAEARDGYLFDHALTQQALYASLSPRRRRRLHIAAGEALEGLPERKRNQRAAELAWHFLQGDDAERAARYSLQAGDQAESVFAHGEAEREYRTALELAGDLDNQTWEAEALEKLGVVVRTVGRYDEALEVLERAARIHHESGELEKEGQVVAQIGLVCCLCGAPEQAISRLRPLVDELEQARPSRSLALLYAALVRLFNLTGNQSGQVDATRRLLDLARELRDDRLLAEAEVHHGASLMYLGRYEEALQLLDSAIPRAEGVGDLHTVCIALGFGSLVYHGWHQVKQAGTYHERAVAVAERLGDPLEISHRAVEAAYFTFLVGDWGASRAYLERALSSALEIDNLRAFLQPLFTLGELAVYSGAWDDASGYLQESMTIAQHLHLTDHLREVQALLAERDLLEGDPEAALDRLRPLLDTPGWEEHLNFLVSLASTLVEAGDLGGAQDAVTRVVAEAARQRLPVVLADVHRVQGAIAREQGIWEAAGYHLEQAVRLSHQITYPWGEARALFEYSLLSARQGSSDIAREQLVAASAIFRRLGAEPYRVRTELAIDELDRVHRLSDIGPTRPPTPR